MRLFRKKLNMSQEDIASKLHIARPVISNWERGGSEPSTSQLARLAQVLGVSLDVLVNNENEGKKIAIIDTSMLIKRPAIINEILEKFEEVIIPKIVIDELNHQKDNGKPWLKRQAWLIMFNIDQIRNKNKKLIIYPTISKNMNSKHDEEIAKIAIERASENFVDKVYVFANDIWFTFLVNEQRSNLFLLSYDDYKDKFIDDKDLFDTEKSQEFMSLFKNKEWNKIQSMEYNPEIDVNFIDPETGYTPLIQAIRHRNIEIIRFIIEKYKTHIDLDCRDNHKYKFTPLLHAAQLRRIDIMVLLINDGADVDAGSQGSNSGNMPLMVCAWHGFSEGVKLLLEHGACLNQQDDNGFTALTKACIKGYSEIVALLIKETDIHIRSRENKKAFEYIKHNKEYSRKIFNYFKEKM